MKTLQQRYDSYRAKARKEIRFLNQLIEMFRSGEKFTELEFIIKEQAKIIIENYKEIEVLKAELSQHQPVDNS